MNRAAVSPRCGDRPRAPVRGRQHGTLAAAAAAAGLAGHGDERVSD
ncbi:MAG TPA: hypothetical protein VGR98_05530 [Streptosporangiaceae bacterium]|nr:hypothetical protein [Streptosporangiaceae bacterium]